MRWHNAVRGSSKERVAEIDFNCDLGEGCGNDAAILPSISSASIACGMHAGDPSTMEATIALCLANGVAIGAHPGYPDREHFGRRELDLRGAELRALLIYQVGALQALVRAAGGKLQHVKPHGALYNRAAVDRSTADVVVDAVHALDPGLRLYALAGSTLVAAARAAGLAVVEEAFVERRYEADGTLAPRGHDDAVIDTIEDAAAQAIGILEHGQVRARTGELVQVQAQSLCLHGDRPDAAQFATRLRAVIESAGHSVRAPAPRP